MVAIVWNNSKKNRIALTAEDEIGKKTSTRQKWKEKHIHKLSQKLCGINSESACVRLSLQSFINFYHEAAEANMCSIQYALVWPFLCLQCVFGYRFFSFFPLLLLLILVKWQPGYAITHIPFF